jgi:hypothetical protein
MTLPFCLSLSLSPSLIHIDTSRLGQTFHFVGNHLKSIKVRPFNIETWFRRIAFKLQKTFRFFGIAFVCSIR